MAEMGEMGDTARLAVTRGTGDPATIAAPEALRFPTAAGAPAAPLLATRALTVRSRGAAILRAVELEAAPRQVYALVGRSGAGKSTLLRCLNRLVDLEPGLTREGEVLFHGRSIYGRDVDADDLRSRIGMLFQRPVVFPRSIGDNVVFGLKRLRRLSRRQLAEAGREALRRVGLWDEVAARLERPAIELSVGQQQRLCLARALATGPEVLLMDEPTSALDGESTRAIERLIDELKTDHAIVLVTHDLEQARRLADRVGHLRLRDGAGELVEIAAAELAAPFSDREETE